MVRHSDCHVCVVVQKLLFFYLSLHKLTHKNNIPCPHTFFSAYPTKYYECMTIQPDPSLVDYWDYGSNNGFLDADPLSPHEDRSGIAPLTDYMVPPFEESGYAPDQGSAFDFTFPDIPVGGSFTFKYFYGAFRDVFEAEVEMVRAGVEMYAMATPRTADLKGCACEYFVFSYVS